MGRPKGAKNKPKGSLARPARARARNNMGQGKAPGKPRSPTQATLTVKQALDGAFVNIGGMKWLEKVARKYPVDFLKIWAKMLPLEVQVTKAPEPINVQVNLHKKQPLVLDNDTGCEIVSENAVLYPDYPGVVSRD